MRTLTYFGFLFFFFCFRCYLPASFGRQQYSNTWFGNGLSTNKNTRFPSVLVLFICWTANEICICERKVFRGTRFSFSPPLFFLFFLTVCAYVRRRFASYAFCNLWNPLAYRTVPVFVFFHLPLRLHSTLSLHVFHIFRSCMIEIFCAMAIENWRRSDFHSISR